MITVLLVAALLVYSGWAIRHIYLKKKQSKSKCQNCPFHDSGACR